MATCSKCGRNGELLTGGRVILGTIDQLKPKIMKCPSCLKLYCGYCSEEQTSFGSSFKCPICSETLGAG